jgi:hypothetical protein
MDHVAFTDSSGIHWSVREDGTDSARAHLRPEGVTGTAWLRFESDLEVRRLWHYPDDWRGLNPLQLESLLERASTVIARFRPAPHGIASLDAKRSQAAARPDANDPSASRDSEAGPAPQPSTTPSDDPTTR